MTTIEDAARGNGAGADELHPQFEMHAESAEQIAEMATDAGVKQLARLVQKLCRSAIVIRGEKGEKGDDGEKGEPGVQGPPGVAGLNAVGSERERLQWLVQTLVDVEAKAAAAGWSARSRESLREGREALVRALGVVSALDESGVAESAQALDAALRPAGRAPSRAPDSDAPPPRANPIVAREADDDPFRAGSKRRRRGTGRVLQHGDVDEGDD